MSQYLPDIKSLTKTDYLPVRDCERAEVLDHKRAAVHNGPGADLHTAAGQHLAKERYPRIFVKFCADFQPVVQDRKCKTVYEQKCNSVNQQKCATVYDTIMEQQCSTSSEQKCETTTEEVSKTNRASPRQLPVHKILIFLSPRFARLPARRSVPQFKIASAPSHTGR